MQIENAFAVMAQPLTAAITVLVLAVVYALSSAIYNLYFHPLAAFPGPASRGAFYFTDFWHLWHGTANKQVKALHARYGDVVRVRPNHLTFSSAQAWKDIYGSRSGKGQMEKDPRFYVFPGDDRTGIIYSNDADHSRMRKLIAHAFSDSAMREQEPILTQYFDLLVERLSQQCAAGKTVDLTKWYNYLTFDVIGDLAFGESFQALENAEYHPWMENVVKGVRIALIFHIVRHYNIALSFLKGLTKLQPSISKAREEHEQFTQLKTKKRLDLKTDRKDFITYILRHNDERGMSRSEIEHTTNFFIIAGSETTATLLSGLSWLLLANPECYERAKSEVRSAFSKESEITLPSTAKLPYLHAILEEGLRLHPPVPIALPRITGKLGDWIDGHWVPPNASGSTTTPIIRLTGAAQTSVGVPQWTVNTSSQHWGEPDTFAPERWLDDGPKKYQHDNRAAMNPFSTGPRNCIGKNLAYSEMRSVMARMLWHFDMELRPDSQNWKDQPCYFMWDKPPLNVRLSFAKK